MITLAGLLLVVGCTGPTPDDTPSKTVAEDTVVTEIKPTEPEEIVEKEPVELPEGEADDGGFTISQIMFAAHDSKLYREALKESPDSTAIRTLAKLYSDLLNRTPPKGTREDWEQRAMALVVALDAIAAGEPNASGQFKRAVNCNSCHSRHK